MNFTLFMKIKMVSYPVCSKRRIFKHTSACCIALPGAAVTGALWDL